MVVSTIKRMPNEVIVIGGGLAGMTAADVVSVTTYVVADQLPKLAKVMAARDAALGGRKVASTLVTVPVPAES